MLALFSPDSQVVIAGSTEGRKTVKLWNVATGVERTPLLGFAGPIAV